MRFFILLLLALCAPLFLPAQWQPVYDRPGGSVNELEKTSNGQLWIGTGNGLFVSDDEGQNWTREAGVPQGARVSELTAVGNTLYAAYDKQLLYSPDAGISWEVLSVPTDVNYFHSLFTAKTALYGVGGTTSSSLFRSDDNGKTWTNLSSPNKVEYAAADGNLLAYTILFNNKIRISNDQGNTWTEPVLPTFTGSFRALSIRGTVIMAAINSGKILVSNNSGASWNLYNLPKTSFYNSNIRWNTGNNQPLISLDADFYNSSTGGTSWTLMTDVPLIFPDFIAENARIYAAGNNGFWYKANAPASWEQRMKGVRASACSFVKAYDDDVFAGFENDRLYRSTDGGLSWTEVIVNSMYATGITDVAKSGNIIAVMLNMSPATVYYSNDNGTTFNPVTFAAAGYGYELSIDNNRLYVQGDIATVITPLSLPNYPIEIIPVVKPPNGYDRDFITASNGNHLSLGSVGDIYRWNGNTDNWDYVTTIPKPQGVSASGSFLHKSGQRIFAGAHRGLYYSDDFGLNWTASVYPLPLALPRAMVSTPQGLFIASDGGILKSADGGLSWTLFNDNLPQPYSYGVGYAQNSLFAGLGPAGIWKNELAAAVISATGTVYRDDNKNGAQDPGEPGLAGILMQSSQAKYASTDASGKFQFYGLNAGETIKPLPNFPNYVATPVQRTYVQGATTGYDFGIFTTLAPDLQVLITPLNPFRPGFTTGIDMTCRNIGTTSSTDAVVKLEFPSEIKYFASFPIPQNVSNNTLSWNIGPLAPNEVFTIQLDFTTLMQTPMGAQLTLTASITAPGADLDAKNNVYKLVRPVQASYDPNDKQAEPANVTPAMLSDGQAIEYTVRFQNTGNYPADFVRIIDKISPDLDLSSFRFQASSHACKWQIKPGRVVEFYFPDIQLPDSTSNEPESHGYVKFSLRPKTNLPLGAAVKNYCDIYFDYNTPVRTNTAGTNVVYFLPGQTPSNAGKLSVKPNPASSFMYLSWKNPVTEPATLRLFDLMGVPRLQTPIETGKNGAVLDVSALPNGTYVAILDADMNRYVRMVVVLHDGAVKGY